MQKQDDSPVILVLNAGSSSIKFAIFDARDPSRAPLWGGKVEDIGPHKPYHAALEDIRHQVDHKLGSRTMAAVAHRVVHGGTKYSQPTRIDRTVLADLRSYIPLAPLHQPFALDAIDVFLDRQPDVPQIACFDTAFHHTMPDVEKMLPLPYDAWEQGLRRFGFHGLSYEYQTIALAERYGEARADARVIVAHLGNGASLCGMRERRSVTTTMGFSALDGLMMGTRCGSLDAGALIYLMEVRKLSLEQVGHMLYHESGLLGVSGLSSDPRKLFEHEAQSDTRDKHASNAARAKTALDLYTQRFVHALGACVAALGGLDMLVFTAGIGEHSATMRERLCAPLAFLGIDIDSDANRAQSDAHASEHHPTGGAALISRPSSRVAVAVEPTNEEWIAARHAAVLLRSA